MKLHLKRTLWTWIVPGIAGVVLFFMLSGQFNFMANAPVTESKESAVERTFGLFSDLGAEYDTLGVIPFRIQHAQLYSSIRDSLDKEAPSPAKMNSDNFFLHGWDVVATGPLALNESFNLFAESIYNTKGLYRAKWDNNRQLRYFSMNSEHGGRTMLVGENNAEFAANVVETTFGHDLSEYRLLHDDDTDISTSPALSDQPAEQLIPFESANNLSSYRYRWKKESGFYSDWIELELRPVESSHGMPSGLSESDLVSVVHFESYNEIEKIPVNDFDQPFVLYFLVVIALLALLVFIEGFGQLFKGKADWSRILFVTFLIGLSFYGWRALYMMNFSEIMTMQANFIVQFNQLVSGLVMGIFVAIAYIGWEAYARGEKSFQIGLIDAFWQGKFYLSETGSAIIKGFSLAGILLGITALYLTFTGLIFFQASSQFGFVDLVNRPFLLALNASILTTAAITSIAIIGIIYHFFDKRIRIKNISIVLSIIIGGLIMTAAGRFFGTDGSITEDAFLFMLIAIPIFTAYRISGVVTVFSGIWLFAVVTQVLPYIQSPSLNVAMNAWGQIAFAALILSFGIVAYRFAPSLKTVQNYVPDYERKLMRNLRFENEMQIARVTQEKLLPRHHPVTDHYELHGFFLPSFEVGGDYFDYVNGAGPNGESYLTITVVDVSGKSMRAAMQAVFTSGLLRSRMVTDQPSKILREICPVVYEKTDAKTFITCMIGRYEARTGLLTFSNAGHCLPILKRDGKAEYLVSPEPKFPLGVRESVSYTDVSVELKAGDLLLFYSDGFPEAVNEQGERIGFDQALNFIETLETDELSPMEICKKIRNYILDFSIERLADDTTVVCLKIK